MRRHLLVTGGCGFIGSNFVRFVLSQRPDWCVTNLDCLAYSGNRQNLTDVESGPAADRYQFVHGDICDRSLVEPLAGRCDALVHFAAESHVDRSIVDARPFVQTNVLGTQSLLDVWTATAVRLPAGSPRRFVHISTDEVYGSLPLDRPDLKFTEQSPIKPSSPYAASKAASDLLVAACHHTHGLDAVITRCSNNFGPYQYPEKVIPLFVTNLLEGRKVPLYGDGLNQRDWLHVEDHCQAILAVLEQGTAGDMYNIGGDNEQSNRDLTGAILRIMGQDESMIQPVADRFGHDRRYAIDATKIKRELGWEPTRSAWPEALESTVRWYTDQAGWWRPLKNAVPAMG